ncbi:MAG TPA: hypothetical protein VGJ91_17060 [Polyangiaceae bacterium]
MRRLLGTMAASGVFAISGAAWACGDVADSHDDTFAQMTKPQPVATAAPVKKAPELQAQKVDKRTAKAPQSTAAPVKVAARTTPE